MWSLASLCGPGFFPHLDPELQGRGRGVSATLPTELCMENRVPKDTLTGAAIIPRWARCILAAIPSERPRGPKLTSPGLGTFQGRACDWLHELRWVIKEQISHHQVYLSKPENHHLSDPGGSKGLSNFSLSTDRQVN